MLPPAFVVKDKCLGRVEEALDTVFVRFQDNSLCKIEETGLDELEPVHSTPLLDDTHPFFPGQIVRGPPAFKRGRWLRGAYKASKHKQGKVVRVDPCALSVVWLANQDGAADPGDDYVRVKNIEHLDHFSWTWWQVGDRGMLAHPDTAAGGGGSGAAALPAAGGGSASASGGGGAAPGSLPRSRAVGSRARRRQSRQRQRGGRGGTAGPGEDAENNCVEIVRSTTAVDVRWQDGTLTTGEPARTLVPILPDGTDFQAGDFVTEKSDEDPSAAAGEQNASAALTRTGIIRSVNARERTCAVSWAAGPGTGSQDTPDGSAAPPAVSFAEAVDGEFSVYELVPHPDFSFRRGLPVLRLAFDSAGQPVDDMAQMDALEEDASEPSAEPAGGADPEADDDSEGDSSDWETDEDGDSSEATDAAPKRGPSRSIYGEVVEVSQGGQVQVRWSDGTTQLCDAGSLFVVPEEDEMMIADVDDDGDWETASEGGEEVDALGNDVDAVMRQFEDQQEQEASVASESVTSAGPASADAAAASAAEPEQAAVSSPQTGSSAGTPSGAPVSRFDCIEGSFADHRFRDRSGPASNQRAFGRCVTKEWGLLQSSLPDGIYVRASEEHMDLLRAVLMGPSGTPFEDSLFFFDIHLPADYPASPPAVSYFSYGERLNPNLYENGKVCLSLLGTWAGQAGETWNPKSSNLLQLVLSIQGLVLVEEPFYLEPGLEALRGTDDGLVKSLRYNEGAALFTVRALNRCLGALPDKTEAICRKEMAERGPRLVARLQHLLARDPDPAQPYGSAGFQRMLTNLLPTTEAALRSFLGDPAAEAEGEGPPAPEPKPQPEPEPEVAEPGPRQGSSESSDDDL